MNTPTPASHRLGPSTFLQLTAPVTLCAERGTLWITQDAEPDDVLLESGECRRFEGDTTLTVGSWRGDAVVQVRPVPRPAHRLAGLARMAHALGRLMPRRLAGVLA